MTLLWSVIGFFTSHITKLTHNRIFLAEMIQSLGDCKGRKDKEGLYYLLRELKDKWDELSATAEEEGAMSSEDEAFNL